MVKKLYVIAVAPHTGAWIETSDRRTVDRVTAECIREIIYKDKERIVDLIVNRASRHMKNLAAKKFVEQLNEEL